MGLLLVAGGCKSSRKTSRRPYRTERPASTSGSKTSTPGKEEKRKLVHSTPDALIREAEKWLGTPYRYGGSERGKGTDCSGLTMEVYRTVTGLKIPRNSAAQQEFCIPMKRDKLETGDLVFFSSKKGGGRVSHVGLYVNDGVFIHASTSSGVIASHLDENYYATHYHSAGRVPGFKRSGAKSAGEKAKKKSEKTKPEKTVETEAPVEVRPEMQPRPEAREEKPAPVRVEVPVHSEPEAPAMEPDTLVRTIEQPPRVEPAKAVSTPEPSVADSIAARVRMAF